MKEIDYRENNKFWKIYLVRFLFFDPKLFRKSTLFSEVFKTN